MIPGELKAEVAKHTWWHRIDLGDGVVTPGACPHGQSDKELNARWAIPEDLTGKVVLDVGCWDGLFSLACARRGAEFVTGVDVLARPTFGLVARATDLGARMEFTIRDAQQALQLQRDIVLCFGVLYHVERPMEVIRNVVAAARELVVIETAISKQCESPAWIQTRGHAGDPTNIWYPTPWAVLDAMQVFGCAGVTWHYTTPDGSRATFVGRKTPQ